MPSALMSPVPATFNRSGAALLTHTVLANRVALRLAVGNVKTTLEHVRVAWERLQAAARELTG